MVSYHEKSKPEMNNRKVKFEQILLLFMYVLAIFDFN
jgi:hypothetical protein